MSQRLCPFCSLDESDRVFYRDDVIAALWDGYAVTPGHALVVPRRHVATWFEATDEERAALTRGIDIARDEVFRKYRGSPPDGFNIGINVGEAAGQTVFHLHVHLIPRYRGDVPDPTGGVRHVIPGKGNYRKDEPAGDAAPGSEPESGTSSSTERVHFHPRVVHPILHRLPLVRGGTDRRRPDELRRVLRDEFDRATRVDVAVAFTTESGVALLEDRLRTLLSRDGARLRFLTGDYLGGTEPEALERLLELAAGRDAELRVFEARETSFHPKAYIFHYPDGAGTAWVGSSNLSRVALTTGVEWNYGLHAIRDREGYRDVVEAFDELFHDERTVPLTEEWIEEYRRRRPNRVSAGKAPEPPPPPDPPEPPPMPHGVQVEALLALEQTRKDGNEAGLVVLATGLGKTYLSAFDSNRPEFGRVLFVAHREEILAQARKAFRSVRPDAVLGAYAGRDRAKDADVLFASIMTIGRREHLSQFAPDAFDYIVVDEFHHAAAASYRRLIDHFRPKFMLGLTATPERTDGGDLLALCDENLVYRCDLFEGIRRERLCPFHYFGVPDVVDYAQIPWRSTRFDEEALTSAVATEARAQNALEQWQKLRGNGKRTLAFCVSQRHADFMAGFFEAAGVRVAAVHSGPTSAGRERSLAALRHGEISVLFAVDMFNEGLDVPEIDTVLMLRPTESRIIWLQQFGRGLRRAADKPFVTVVDYIGNHKVFLTKPRALLGLARGQAEVRDALERLAALTFELPPGCEVTYELEAIEILKQLTGGDRTPAGALQAYYREFVDEHGVRPRAVEAFHDGFNPKTTREGFGSWLGFVKAMGGLSEDEAAALEEANAFLAQLEITPMAKSYKMLVLEAMLAKDAFPGQLTVAELVDGFAAAARRSAELRRDVEVLDDPVALRRKILEMPVEKWTAGRGTGGVAYFEFDDDVFRTAPRLDVEHREALIGLVRELVEWRLAEYLDRAKRESERVRRAANPDLGFVCKVIHSGGKPIVMLDREHNPGLPEGWTEIFVGDDRYRANFVKIALNVVRKGEGGPNVLADILRDFFGEHAGLPGTRRYVVFEREGSVLRMRPRVEREESGQD